MKAVLVIDLPVALEQLLGEELLLYIGHMDCRYIMTESAVLRSLPSFKAVDLNDTRDVVMFCHGWNTCLAEITGETK